MPITAVANSRAQQPFSERVLLELQDSETLPSVRVDLGDRSYDIDIGTGTLGQAGLMLAARQTVSHAVIITDENVEEPHARVVASSLTQQGIDVDLLVMPAGESVKSTKSSVTLWNKLIEIRADRKTVIVAVGGGVIGDLAGFVAATFTRGLPLMQVPTTLLAQVDSSVGGKVGVNLPAAKNMVGAFWQPLCVLIDSQVLSTLPHREYRAGLAEVVKYGVILDRDFFEYLEGNISAILERQPDVLEHIIARCCRLKADVVEGDERETSGLRAVLNYGHTFGHALESVTGYGQFLHGEAVAIGMLCASRLAERMGRIDPAATQRQHDLLTALGLPVLLPDIDHDRLIAAMLRDKKVEHGKLRFVLPSEIGKVELVDGVDETSIRTALAG